MSTVRVAAEKWKALALQGGKEAAADLAIAKALSVDMQAGEGRMVTAKASTAAPDRDNDTIAVEGWSLGGFAKNGPILWAHDSSQLPVGRSLKTWIDAVALWCEMEFPEKDVHPFGDSVYQMIKAGYLNAVSVGFSPLEWSINEERGSFAVDFKRQELLEISIVPIPANPDALIQARSAGAIDLAPVIEWAEKVLDGARGPGLWVPVPKARVEAARKAMTGAPAALQVPAVIETKLAPQASAPTVVDKRGRVLSSGNETKLRDAVSAIEQATESIEAVLAQVQSEEDSAEPSATKADQAHNEQDVLGVFSAAVDLLAKAPAPPAEPAALIDVTPSAIAQLLGQLDPSSGRA